jgi:hypothetical protein
LPVVTVEVDGGRESDAVSPDWIRRIGEDLPVTMEWRTFIVGDHSDDLSPKESDTPIVFEGGHPRRQEPVEPVPL